MSKFIEVHSDNRIDEEEPNRKHVRHKKKKLTARDILRMVPGFLWKHLVLHPFYWLVWRRRDIGLLVWGINVPQTEDLHGVVLSDGLFVPYGPQFNRLFFSGRIRDVVGTHHSV